MPYTPYTYTSPDDPAREDEGLFGRESVTWRVMNSRIMWVAVVRALYLQALHPRVIRGTLQNAATITEPVDAWARLRRTRKFIETRTFGTIAEAELAGRRVRKIHESLTGTDPDGTRYRVDDPELLLWVHCGEVASCADVARRSRLPFSAADLDAFVDEHAQARSSSASTVRQRPLRLPNSTPTTRRSGRSCMRATRRKKRCG